MIDERIAMKAPVASPWHHPVSRRAFLRGAGVSLALPWLESLALRFGN